MRPMRGYRVSAAALFHTSELRESFFGFLGKLSIMRLLIPFLSVAALCSALVIPDQEVLAEDFCIADRSDNPEIQAPDETNGGDVMVESWWQTLATRKRQDPVSSLALSVLEFLASFDQLTHFQQNVKYHGDDGDDSQGDSASAPYHFNSCPPHVCPATNQTLWQIISQSRRTERIAELLSREKKLVALLNSSHANYTFFAPTNRALEDFLEDNSAPSSWSDILAYHIVHGAFPIKLLRHQQTLTTELNQIGQGHQAQRLTVTVDEDEVFLNEVSRVIQEDNEIASPPHNPATTSPNNPPDYKQRRPPANRPRPSPTPSHKNPSKKTPIQIEHFRSRPLDDSPGKLPSPGAPTRRHDLRAGEFRLWPARREGECVPVLAAGRTVSARSDGVPYRLEHDAVLGCAVRRASQGAGICAGRRTCLCACGVADAVAGAED